MHLFSILLGTYGDNAAAIDISNAHINANGTLNKTGTASTGKGGTVTVTFAKGAGQNPIDVNSIINVEAGSQAPVSKQQGASR